MTPAPGYATRAIDKSIRSWLQAGQTYFPWLARETRRQLAASRLSILHYRGKR